MDFINGLVIGSAVVILCWVGYSIYKLTTQKVEVAVPKLEEIPKEFEEIWHAAFWRALEMSFFGRKEDSMDEMFYDEDFIKKVEERMVRYMCVMMEMRQQNKERK